MSASAAVPSSRRWVVVLGLLTAAVLILTVKSQVYDTNFYSLWEAAALLAGDHPYRDFFEWGIPGQAVLSAAVQWLVGYRLIGEFVTQWAFILAGVLIAFVLGLRVSRSIAASMTTALVATLILADTPIYHYPKLFFYPLAIYLAWRYMDAPGPRHAAALGAVTSVAFLFRHDHGIYVGLAAVLGFAASLAGGSPARSWRVAARDAAVYAGMAAVLLLPWMIFVHRSEGMFEYVQTRYVLYAGDAAVNPFPRLLDMQPVRLIRSDVLSPGPESQEHSRIWIEQVALLVPLGLLVSAAIGIVTHRIRRLPPPPDTHAVIVAGVFLAIVDFRLFREPSYAQLVAPITAAMAAPFLRWGPALTTRLDQAVDARVRIWRGARWLTAAALLLLTVAAAGVNLRSHSVVQFAETLEDLPEILARLSTYPPIDGFVPAADVPRLRRSAGDTLTLMVLVRYVHDCTRTGDRVLVSGSTPFDVPYLTERPIAGGHLYWHKQWRADPRHEAETLALLRRQSVPFALATEDPVLQDLEHYPRLYEHFRSRYTVVEGSGGYLLVESGRPATGRWALGLPCFS